MRGNVHPHPFWIEIALVDTDLVLELGDVRYVNAHGAVFQRLHKFVIFQPAIFGFVGVADDDLVDIGLGEFFGFYAVFLAGTQQVV